MSTESGTLEKISYAADTLKNALASVGHDISDEEAALVAQKIDEIDQLDCMEILLECKKAREAQDDSELSGD